MRHETHIPAQQNKTEKDTRVSSPYEDSRGTQSDQAPPPGRTQEPSSLTAVFTQFFPKHLRLRKRQDFLSLQKNGRRLVGKLLCVDYQPSSTKTARLGITAPSRYGNSPERNRFKRLVREVFRKNLCHIPSDFEFSVAPRQRAKKASEADIRQELLDILCSIPTKN